MRKPKLAEGTTVLVDANHKNIRNIKHLTKDHGYLWLVVRFERDDYSTYYDVDGRSNEVYIMKSVATGHEHTLSGSYFVGGDPNVQEG